MYICRLTNSNGTVGAYVPEHAGMQLSSVLNDVGSISLNYPVGGVNATVGMLADREVTVLDDGVERPNQRYIMEDRSEDLADDNEEAAIIQLTGRSFLSVLDEAIVYPITYPNTDPPYHKFVEDSAGAIMGTLISKAITRGCTFRGLTFTFTNNVDSNGVAWDKEITIQYNGGVSLSEVMTNLVAQQMCDVETVGRELKMYNYGTLARERANVVIFSRARDIKDSPEKVTTRELKTVALLAGADNLYAEYADAGAVNTYRRRETYVSQGNLTDTTTLAIVGQATIDQMNHPKMERTHGLVFGEGAMRPWVDFLLGDWVGSRVRGVVERYRLRQISLELDDTGDLVGGQVVLNDLFNERAANLSRRIDGIVNGTTITGTSNATSGSQDDVVPPNAVTDITASGAFDYIGQLVSITANWSKPLLNQDGTSYLDHDQYHIQWKYVSDMDYIHGTLTAEIESITFGGVEPNRAITIRIRAVDEQGNAGPWAQWDGASPTDTVPPPTPATPVVEATMGYLRVTWTGLGSAGQAMPRDFNYVEVHSSPSSGFTATPATRRDIIPSGAGAAYISGDYSVLTYVRLVAVDNVGNKSTQSAQASGLASQVVGNDVFVGAIGSAQLANLAVTTAKIADLAVNDAKIGNLNVGKLTSGTITADVIQGGNFRTGTTGARTEFSGTGVRLYDATNAITVQLNSADGSATFKGTITAAEISGYIRVRVPILYQEIGLLASPSPTLYMSTMRAWQKDSGYIATGFTTPNLGVTTIVQSPGMWLKRNDATNVLDQTVLQITINGAGAQIDGSDGATWTTGSMTCYFPTNNKLGNQIRSRMGFESYYADISIANDQKNHYPALVYGIPQLSGSTDIGLRANSNSGTSSKLELVVCQTGGTQYALIAASAFVVSSGAKYKKNIQPLDFDPVEIVMGVESKRWNFAGYTIPSVGPVADDLPREIFPEEDRIDMATMMGVLWAAVRQLAQEVRHERRH